MLISRCGPRSAHLACSNVVGGVRMQWVAAFSLPHRALHPSLALSLATSTLPLSHPLFDSCHKQLLARAGVVQHLRDPLVLTLRSILIYWAARACAGFPLLGLLPYFPSSAPPRCCLVVVLWWVLWWWGDAGLSVIVAILAQHPILHLIPLLLVHSTHLRSDSTRIISHSFMVHVAGGRAGWLVGWCGRGGRSCCCAFCLGCGNRSALPLACATARYRYVTLAPIIPDTHQTG